MCTGSLGSLCDRVLSVDLGLCNCLDKVEIGFRVSELFKLYDLQASVIVGYDMRNEDHFAGHVHPERGLRLGCGLGGR